MNFYNNGNFEHNNDINKLKQKHSCDNDYYGFFLPLNGKKTTVANLMTISMFQ